MWQVFIQWPTRWIEELEVAFVFNFVSLLAFYGWLVVLLWGALVCLYESGDCLFLLWRFFHVSRFACCPVGNI